MDYKWMQIIALDCAIAGLTIEIFCSNVFPYNMLYGAAGGVALVAAHNWALEHFAEFPAE